jgi:hypothetical protein
MADDWKPQQLTCAGKTPDKNSVTDNRKNVPTDSLDSVAQNLVHLLTQKALKEQKEFTDQDCTAKCDKIIDAPGPALDTINYAHVQGKKDVFNVTVVVKWNATVECKLKPEVLLTKNIPVPGQTGPKNTLATIKYECIEGWIWVLIFTGDGKTELGRYKTEQKCPLAQGKTIDEYTYSEECVDSFWWVILTDPKTHRIIMQVKTSVACKQE